MLGTGGSDAMFLTTLIGFTTAYFLIGVSLVVDAIRRLSRNNHKAIPAKVKQPALKNLPV